LARLVLLEVTIVVPLIGLPPSAKDHAPKGELPILEQAIWRVEVTMRILTRNAGLWNRTNADEAPSRRGCVELRRDGVATVKVVRDARRKVEHASGA